MDFDAAIAAHSVAEEYAHIARQRCACGGSLRFVKQALLRKDERYFDLVETRCRRCGAKKEFLFDISSFFPPTNRDSIPLGCC